MHSMVDGKHAGHLPCQSKPGKMIVDLRDMFEVFIVAGAFLIRGNCENILRSVGGARGRGY